MKKRIYSAILCLSMLLSLLTLVCCSGNNQDGNVGGGDNTDNGGAGDASESIVILYENDVHCAIEGYSKLAAMKKELSGSYDHVGVVSSGDFVQGGTIGAVSRGEYIIRLMNLVGYDAITPGNHERRSMKDADDDPMYDVACKLDLEDLYRENLGVIKLKFGNNSIIYNKHELYAFKHRTLLKKLIYKK